MLMPIAVPPGIHRAGTQYQSRGRWYDANLVRWFEGAMRPVGGWNSLDVPVTGVPRAAHAWRGNTGSPWLAVGTNSGIFVYDGGSTTDITDDSTYEGYESTAGFRAYGSGLYGTGPFGIEGATSGAYEGPLVVSDAAVWTLDNFGQILVGILAPSDGKLRSWNPADGTSAKMAVVAGSPPNSRAVVVTPERYCFVLGANGDPRSIVWPDQEQLGNYTDPLRGFVDVWTPSETNTAGDFPLTTDGRLMSGLRMPRETLIFTDTDLHSAIYIGGTLVYSFENRGSKCGIIAQNAAVSSGDVAYWMSGSGFFQYDGAVTRIPCEVSDYIFTRINRAQTAKIFAMSIAAFDELWWFYPSSASNEIDSYVVYNRREGHWNIGSLDRTCGIDRGVFQYPILFSAEGDAFEHERGFTHPGAGAPFAETGPIQLADGDNVYMMRGLVPDEKTLGDVQAYIYSKFFPTDVEMETGPITLSDSTKFRLTARQMRLRVEATSDGVDWRVGEFRFDGMLGGER